MRESLETLLTSAITIEYSLPHGDTPKVTVSNVPDDCFRNISSSEDIKELIYNGLIDYGVEESKINISSLSSLHKLVLETKLKYDKDATEAVKVKHGFFGEVMLYLIIRHFYKASTLVSRGFFYNPLENSETKGYDTYQIRYNQTEDNTELWFGEVKFYGQYSTAAKKIFDNVDKALSNTYLEKNFKAFVNFLGNLDQSSKAAAVVKSFMENPDVSIIQLIKDYNMTLVYPALLICDDKNKPYDEIVKQIVDHINKKYTEIKPDLAIPYKFFFMILPVSDSRGIKTDVIKWIGSKHPLI